VIGDAPVVGVGSLYLRALAVHVHAEHMALPPLLASALRRMDLRLHGACVFGAAACGATAGNHRGSQTLMLQPALSTPYA
jgi:hypothetical protein